MNYWTWAWGLIRDSALAGSWREAGNEVEQLRGVSAGMFHVAVRAFWMPFMSTKTFFEMVSVVLSLFHLHFLHPNSAPEHQIMSVRRAAEGRPQKVASDAEFRLVRYPPIWGPFLMLEIASGGLKGPWGRTWARLGECVSCLGVPFVKTGTVLGPEKSNIIKCNETQSHPHSHKDIKHTSG